MAEKDQNIGPEKGSTPMGQYYLLDKIAQGGMAEIYKGLAYDLHGIKRTVVIKKILPQIAADREFINMLINEAKIAVMLSHGNIAQIYDLGKVGEDYFMVMEYVEGRSLSQIHKRSLKVGSLVPIDIVCYLISEVASGLDYMHRRSDGQGKNLGIVHRDISPQNVIVSYSGTVKIIDFGIAKAAIQLHITDSGVLKGKFAYMSPEQAKGDAVDHRTDIFSLGVILHELLTGKRLFKGKDKRETLRNVRRAEAPAPSTLRADLPAELDQIVMKALEADPRKRYMWASELRNDLLRFLHTHYPEFQSSAVVDHIREIFKAEIEEDEERAEDAKTPFLIIDHTQSAIMPEKMEITNVTRLPPQLLEFMLDEETPLPTTVEEPEETKESKDLVKVEEKELIEFKEPRKEFQPLGLLKKHWKAIIIPVIVVFVLVAAFYLYQYLSLRLATEEAPPPVSPVEEPHMGTVTVTSTPAGASIFVDDKNTNLKTPSTLPPILPNEHHTIGLFLEGHNYHSFDLTLKPDETATLHTDLVVNYGELKISSTPEGAEVYLDGKLAGVTPFFKDMIKPDTIFEVRVVKKGYREWSKKVQVKADAPAVLHTNLLLTEESLVPRFLREAEHPSMPAETPSAPAEETPAPTKGGSPKIDENILPPAE